MKYICELCKSDFTAPPSQNARYCTRACYDKSRVGIFKCSYCYTTFTYYKSHKKGKNVFCSRKCHRDFIESDIENHPRWQGKSYRKIVEKHIGRKLKSSEVIHHINHNHSDNRIQNLEITDRAKHCTHHKPRLGTGR